MEKSKINFKSLLPYIAFAVLIVYLFYHLFNMLFSDAELYIVKNETLYEYATLEGYVFRDETPLYSNGSGSVSYTYDDGEKIAAGSTVARVGDGEDSAVVSENAGYFYKNADGYENIFTGAAATDMTYDELLKAFDAKPSSLDGCVGKVATDFSWYFVCETAESRFENGKTYSFSISGETYDMTLERSPTKNGAHVLVFKCTKTPREAFDSRLVSAKATVAVYGGATVPKDAVYKSGGETFVYLFDEGFARKCAVDVIYTDDSLSVVSCETDVVGRSVIKGVGLYDGKAMK